MAPSPPVPFATLREQIEALDPADASALRRAHDEVGAARDAADRSGWPDLGACLEAVARLLDSALRREHAERAELVATAARVLRAVQPCAHVLWGETAEPPPAHAPRTLELKDERPTLNALPPIAPTTRPGPPAPRVLGAELALANEILLGEILLQQRLVTEEQLQEALRVQAITGSKIGETLCNLRILSEEEIAHALRLQAKLREAAARPSSAGGGLALDDSEIGGAALAISEGLLGRTLLAAGKITRAQLDGALHLQAERGLRIGEALVSLGAATRHDIAEAIAVHSRKRHEPTARAGPRRP